MREVCTAIVANGKPCAPNDPAKTGFPYPPSKHGPDTELLLDADRWAVSCNLFARALEMEPARRTAFLEEATGGDAALLNLVLRMLAADDRQPNVIDRLEAALTEHGRRRPAGGEAVS